MSASDTIAIVLAAGLGTRMGTESPKVSHTLAGRAMLAHVLDAVKGASISKTAVVVGPNMQQVRDITKKCISDAEFFVQKERLGTGHAVKVAKRSLSGSNGTVIILYGDTPLLKQRTLKRLIKTREHKSNPALVVLGFETDAPGEYGRIIKGRDGKLEKIVEAREANNDELAVTLCNSGVYAVDARFLSNALDKIKNNNSKKEYYLTDIVELTIKSGRNCSVVVGDEAELLGVNTRHDLALAEAVIQHDLRVKAMSSGCTLIDPASVYFSWDTKLGKDIVIEPNVFFGPGVSVADRVIIKAFSHIEGAKVSEGATIGPFARLRPGTKVGAEARVGNFVEVKNSNIAMGAKISHLSYIGDARIGKDTNIGAGTITCNFDGKNKYRTNIGKEVFVGSNTALIAPLNIGHKVTIGAGSVITQNIKTKSLAITRVKQREIKNWTAKNKKG